MAAKTSARTNFYLRRDASTYNQAMTSGKIPFVTSDPSPYTLNLQLDETIWGFKVYDSDGDLQALEAYEYLGQVMRTVTWTCPEAAGAINARPTLASDYIVFTSRDAIGGPYECAKLQNGLFSIPRLGNFASAGTGTFTGTFNNYGLINCALTNGRLRLPNAASGSPVANDCYFDAVNNELYVYNGSAWVKTTLK